MRTTRGRVAVVQRQTAKKDRCLLACVVQYLCYTISYVIRDIRIHTTTHSYHWAYISSRFTTFQQHVRGRRTIESNCGVLRHCFRQRSIETSATHHGPENGVSDDPSGCGWNCWVVQVPGWIWKGRSVVLLNWTYRWPSKK